MLRYLLKTKKGDLILKLSLFEMQALEFALHYVRPNLKAVYSDNNENIFTGHFFTEQNNDLYLWRKQKSAGELSVRLRKLNLPPALFNGWQESFKNPAIATEEPVKAFDYIKYLKSLENAEYHNPQKIYDSANMELGMFTPEPYYLDYKSNITYLSFIELTQNQYELISLEEKRESK